ncbi:osmotic stress regulator [Fictibacillus macauensis ZFHKF-1]|uniref:Osmotic stress regulator n=1 Tax=Fictibacillus macauensis ZFHKF-1 TaxID=1196324 RepID=I8AL96_9BACL|nr:OsmC family protein [Fictibacillus macauensis]EIT86389.1 osmotic stress regulator [Fictibacillus macauensis ZFHKF-1]
MAEHTFHLKANWPGLRNDIGEIETAHLKTAISIPTEMDGPGIGTNPDEMLLGAAATCYIITLAAMMERSGLTKKSLTMSSEGIVDETNGVITYKKIIHKPVIVLAQNASSHDVKRAQRLAEKAEASCMITRAVQGNIDVSLEATITVAAD